MSLMMSFIVNNCPYLTILLLYNDVFKWDKLTTIF